MLDHVSITVSDYGKAQEFYSKALAPLGYVIINEFSEWQVTGLGAGRPDFWLHGGEAKQPIHVAFAAKSKEQVDAFYRAALAAGGTDNGEPGYRKEYSPGYYGAFVKDADGNNVEAVFHDPDPR